MSRGKEKVILVLMLIPAAYKAGYYKISGMMNTP